MSPAKATRPGFRQSLASTAEGPSIDQTGIHLFHPVYHSYTYPVGCRIDIERILPAKIENEASEELIDNFSEPPAWIERLSPLAVQVGDQILRGKNAPDLMLKIYRLMFDLFGGIGRFIESSIAHNTGEAMRVPFLSLCVDPDTMHTIIETDYESGETTYTNLINLIEKGTVTPCLTTPFHLVMPLLETDAEIRLCVRAGLIFYLRILKIYSRFLESHGENGLLVVPLWLPEGGYSDRVVTIFNDEFRAMCKKEKLGIGHLVLMLDNHQAEFGENDILMKSWNQITTLNGGNGHGRSRKNSGLHAGIEHISALFRDRSFSDWVIHANPSVKKLLDRTIAKVDSDINAQNVHYGWAHFEELEAMTYTPRAILNFQQKLIKLIELGYLPLSPDFYVRGKLRGEFGCTDHEPQHIKVTDNSVGNGWDLEDSTNIARWVGHSRDKHNGGGPVLEPRPYERHTADGNVKESGHPCWKVAWDLVRRKCYNEVVGNLETLDGGMAEILGGMTGQRSAEKTRRNVADFLAHYTYVYWREYFIQHDVAEADINILELTTKFLRAGVKTPPREVDAARAGAAAQAIYFSLDSGRSLGTGCENMDQRGFYQNVVMLTLAICNAMHVYHWLGDTKSAKTLLTLLKTELLDFKGAYARYDLGQYGITKKAWGECMRSEVADSRDNVVRRAALRTAARHLRPLGYTRDFTRQDANMTTNVGHMWSTESRRENFCYENTLFCGVGEV